MWKECRRTCSYFMMILSEVSTRSLEKFTFPQMRLHAKRMHSLFDSTYSISVRKHFLWWCWTRADWGPGWLTVSSVMYFHYKTSICPDSSCSVQGQASLLGVIFTAEWNLIVSHKELKTRSLRRSLYLEGSWLRIIDFILHVASSMKSLDTPAPVASFFQTCVCWPCSKLWELYSNRDRNIFKDTKYVCLLFHLMSFCWCCSCLSRCCFSFSSVSSFSKHTGEE